MFKRFIKAVKDTAKRIWEFIKKLLPKKPKPKAEEVIPKEDLPPEEPAKPEEVETSEEVIPYRLDGVVQSGSRTGFIRIHETNDTRVIQEYFHSVDELLSCISSRRNNDVMRDQYSSDREDINIRSNKRFSLTPNYQSAVRLIRKGYSEILDQVRNGTYSRIKNLSRAYEARKSIPRLGVFGCAPNIQKHLMGLPDAMINREIDPKKTKTIHIAYHPQAPSFVRGEIFVKTGIVLLSAIELIEKSGISVKLDCVFYSGERDGEVIFGTVQLKDYKHRLDILKLCFPIAHPSMLRRIGFKFLETVPGMTQDFTRGYGNNLGTYESKLLYKTNTNCVHIGLDTIVECKYNVEQVIKYIKDHVE